jgi:gas vesicle protein
MQGLSGRNGIEQIIHVTKSAQRMKTSLMFLLGIGMGTVMGILIAPEAGKITRRKIRDEADRLIDQALDKKRNALAADRLEADDLEPDATVIVSESRYTI